LEADILPFPKFNEIPRLPFEERSSQTALEEEEIRQKNDDWQGILSGRPEQITVQQRLQMQQRKKRRIVFCMATNQG
jgi:hypothetical protein